MLLKRCGFAALAVCLGFTVAKGDVTPNSLFSDNAVIQRDCPVPVWGTARDGEKVVVEFAGQKVSTAAKEGKWLVRLAPMPADVKPQTMRIRGEANEIEVKNLLIGDVWVAGGQSNMERQLGPRRPQKDIEGWKEAAENADYPEIRQYFVQERFATKPVDDARGAWAVCTPKAARQFTAVGFFFARDVYLAEKVPVGILFSAWGGTEAEAWMSPTTLSGMPAFAEALKALPQSSDRRKAYLEALERWYRDYDLGDEAKENWAASALDPKDWKPAKLPVMFSKEFDGLIWFRKEIDLDESWADKVGVVSLGPIDDADTTWVNGHRVGGVDSWSLEREYTIPAGVLKAGKNVIVVRVLNKAKTGGFVGQAEQMKLSKSGEPAVSSVSLAGEWLAKKSLSANELKSLPKERGGVNQHFPSALYNAMLAPLQPFPIKGAVWYQGEANNDRPKEYRNLFPELIADWRRGWAVGDFPFLFVQIAPYKDMTPELREAQFLTLAKSPNTAMVVTADVGDAEDIHPARKEPVGTRLALAARALAYGERLEYSGPLYESMKIEGGNAIISFTHRGGGLVAERGELKGFTIAGADKKFVPAKAVIKGDTVVVSSDEVASPTAVRYGWANVPDVNLFNKDGLPASPFRTDVE